METASELFSVQDEAAAAALLPDSCRRNSEEEQRLLTAARSFSRQYSTVFPARKPPLLCPANECGVEKFVSTTLRPSPSCRLHLHTWRGCASFVADFLSPEFLDPPTELPRTLRSPACVLRRRAASCFEAASLLCCLLLGADYDAYCVSGYADREMCLLDRSLQDCPLLDGPPRDQEAQDTASETAKQQQQQQRKYSVKPQRALQSRFLMEPQEEEEEQQQELGRRAPPPDPLHGLRLHCWVLVLSGRRGVQEDFFVDPLSGSAFPTRCSRFLGVESLWNHVSYYCNLQDCSAGCSGLTFDLEDGRLWEPLLFAAVSRNQLSAEAETRRCAAVQSGSLSTEEVDLQLRVLDMPRSWISPFSHLIPPSAPTSWPQTNTHILYWKAELQSFTGRSDGLIRRWTSYRDVDRTEVAAVKEWFSHRADFLELRVREAGGRAAERFLPGNVWDLLSLSGHADTELQMEFGVSRTTDHLRRRVLTPGQLTETFGGARHDFLYSRRVVFRPHLRIGQLEQPIQAIEPQVAEVEERFRRDEARRPDRDAAHRRFLGPERQFQLTCHPMASRSVPSRRTLCQPHAMVAKSCFQVDPAEPVIVLLPPLQKVHKDLMVDILRSLRETHEILMLREQQQKEQQEEKQEEEKQQKEEQEEKQEEEKQQEEEQQF